jgi:hypothetical protein
MPGGLNAPVGNGNGAGAPPMGGAPSPENQPDTSEIMGEGDDQIAAPPKTEQEESELYRLLIKRANNGGPGAINLSPEEEMPLVQHVLNDIQTTELSTRTFKTNMREMLKNWRGTKEKKDFPFEGASNIKVPLTSSYIETMKARIVKAIFGGERISKLSKYDGTDPEELEELNQWFEWELREIVKLKEHFEGIVHNVLVTGIGLSVDTYHHEMREMHSRREFEIMNDERPLSQSMNEALQKILADSTMSEWGTDMPMVIDKEKKPGLFSLKGGGNITFSLDIDDTLTNPPRLVADIWHKETVFDGVRPFNVNLEDLCVVNVAGTVDEIPFLGIRQWVDVPTFRDRIADGFFIDYGEEENRRIIQMADIKVGEYVQREQTDLQDREEGTDSQDITTNEPDRKYLEVYRWEGWWRRGITNTDDLFQSILESAEQYIVWVAVRPQRIIRIKRLEDVNKDGKRTAVKYDFIREPGRFFSMGLAEWVRHSQAELDAIHNQRLDAGLLTNVPFFFYKPTAGIKGQVIKIEPGKGWPVNDPTAVNFPKTNWQPVFSFQEEALVKRYAGEQAGLTDPAVGQMPTKRLSASEFVGTASALDLRTEQIVEGFIRSLRQELYRILGLYQQYGSRVRMFRAGGEAGNEITKRFERDRLSGRIDLKLTANLQQMNEQLERQIAMDMLQLLMNEILIQTGIVNPTTIYQALNKLAKSFHYDGVKLNEPSVGPYSDAPHIEEHQMFMGQKPIGPTMNENHEEHLASHARTASDQQLISRWSTGARMMLQQHIQETIKVQQAKAMLDQQRAAMATQMAQSMESKGIRPGKSGQSQPGKNLGPGTQNEGVRGQEKGGSVPPPGVQ